MATDDQRPRPIRRAQDDMYAVHASELEEPRVLSEWRPLCGITKDHVRIPDHLLDGWTPTVTINGLSDVTCIVCRGLLGDTDAHLPGNGWAGTRMGHRPIRAIEINGHRISGDEFEMGSLHHDIRTGTVTLTFCNVTDLSITYADLEATG